MSSPYSISEHIHVFFRRLLILPIALVVVFSLTGVSSGQSAAEFKARMEAALAAAESALAAEEARLDELADRNRERTLTDGRPSVAQATANLRLLAQRIREFKAGELGAREALNSLLVSLDSDVRQLARRLSAQRQRVEQQTAAQQRAEREQAEKGEAERQAREQAERQKAELERVERERAEREEAERKGREQVAREPVGLQWLEFRGDIPRDAVIGGQYNAEPVHVCRDFFHDGIYVGVLYSGSHSGSCRIGWRGAHKREPDFDVLTGTGEIKWIEVDGNFVDPGLLKADTVVTHGDGGFSVEALGDLDDPQPDKNVWYVFRGGRQANGRPIFVCSADHDRGPVPGGVVNGNCHFAYSGEKTKNVFRLLVVKGQFETPEDASRRREERLAANAGRHLQAGNLEDALDNAKRMTVAPLRDQTLQQIAMVHFQAGNFQDAMTTAALMETGQHRDEVLAKLVDAFRQAWDLQDALRAAKQVGSDGLRREKFHGIALAQIAAKDYEGALATAELSRAPTNPYRDKVLARVVDTYREAWNLQDALSIAEQVGNDNVRREKLYGIALAQVTAKDYGGALATAQLSHAPNNDYRDRVFAKVAAAHREAWKFQEALGVADQFYNDDWRRDEFYRIAMGQVDTAKDYEGALATAQLSHAPNNDYRDRVFAKVAAAYREAWRFQEALSIAEQLYNDDWRRDEFYRIAMGQVDTAKDYEGALATAQLSHAPNNDYRDRVFAKVAAAYREAWKFQEALSVAEQLYNDDWRRDEFYRIAMGQVDTAKDYEGALATAQLSHAPNNDYRDRVFARVVDVYRGEGKLQNALRVAEQLADDNARDSKFRDVALAQIEARDYEGATATANRIKAARLRDQVLDEVAKRTQ